jgi:hypothetical protein
LTSFKNSFERGKPWSIISLIFYKNNLNTYVSIYCCIKLQELSEIVDVFIIILVYLVISLYLARFRIE